MGWTMGKRKTSGLVTPGGNEIKTQKKIPVGFRAMAEQMIKALDIHEGHWSIEFAFSSAASNVTINNGKEEKPALTTAILGMDLMKWDKPNNRSVDAAFINPAPGKEARRTPDPDQTSALLN